MVSLPFVLASASPRRKDLLAQIGVEPFAIRASDIDETPFAAELPRSYAQRMAEEKARACDDDTNWVLAADTVVAVGRRILPKAEDLQTAQECLALLSGRAHRVYGGIALRQGDRVISRVIETRLQMKRLDRAEQAAYLASNEWRGKAGGYAIQGRAAVFVRALQGSYTNVVGLSLPDVYAMLTGVGLRPSDAWSTANSNHV